MPFKLLNQLDVGVTLSTGTPKSLYKSEPYTLSKVVPVASSDILPKREGV